MPDTNESVALPLIHPNAPAALPSSKECKSFGVPLPKIVVVDPTLQPDVPFEQGQRISIENIGCHYVVAALQGSGYPTEFLRTSGEPAETVAQRIADMEPRCVVIGSYSYNYSYAVEIAQAIPRAGAPAPTVALGGYHGPFLPEQVPVCVHHVLRGAGEYAALKLAEGIRTGQSLPRIIDGGRVTSDDIDQIPVPFRDASLFAPRGLFFPPPDVAAPRIAAIVGSRGCIAKCEFCLSARTGLASRDPTQVVEEMKSLRETYAIDVFHFVDPLFNANPRWVGALCKALDGLDFRCTAMVDFRVDRPLLEDLRNVGFYWLLFGLEVPNNKKRRDLGKRAGEAEVAFGLCNEVGILTRAFIILGLPTMTSDDVDALFDLPERFPHIGNPRPNFACPFPGTKWWSQLDYRNLVTKDFRRFTTEEPVFSSHFDIPTLVRLRDEFQRHYYQHSSWTRGAEAIIARAPSLSFSYQHAARFLVSQNVCESLRIPKEVDHA